MSTPIFAIFLIVESAEHQHPRATYFQALGLILFNRKVVKYFIYNFDDSPNYIGTKTIETGFKLVLARISRSELILHCF